MKKIFFSATCIFLLAACTKNKPEPTQPPATTHPAMTYLNLHDTAVAFNRAASFDLDGNGEKDVYFSTLLVGDPVYQVDKRQWLVSSSFNANLPVNANEQIPVLRSQDSIPVVNFSGYSWYNASSILLAQKILSDNQPPYWEGAWKEAFHRFIPIQIIKQDGLYNGWVEVSFSTAEEKVILHKAAVSTEANKTIKAGKH